MSQPDWELLGNLGDAHPIDHGGYFVYRDKTGVYDFEAELLVEPEECRQCDYDEPDEEDGEAHAAWMEHVENHQRWEIYRACLDKLKEFRGYLVSDKYNGSWPHPLHKYEEWFVEDLPKVAQTMDTSVAELRAAFCSDDWKARAWAYRCVGDYHGWANLDSYPIKLTRAEVEKRYEGVV